ncbi:MAG: hypothetical protein F4Y91_13760 [Gemmatimonadetes bacterium]|nr:hypothetical protein [Gemmatimonadota bacterium]MYB71422.1 hypothetical protein [Gemmatimonadota bacterium]
MIALCAICHEMATFIRKSTLDLTAQGKLTCPEPSARWDDAKLALAVDTVGLEVVVIDGKDSSKRFPFGQMH